MQLRYLGHGSEIDASCDESALIDNVKSLVWTERYCKAGDFELVLAMDNETNQNVVQDIVSSINKWGVWGGEDCYFDIVEDWYTYVTNEGITIKGKTVMIAETIDIVENVESGMEAKITGRSLHSWFDRRTTYGTVRIGNKTPKESFKIVLNEFGYSSSPTKNSNRSLPILQPMPQVTQNVNNSMKLTCQYTGDTVTEIVEDLCGSLGYGYNVLWKGHIKESNFPYDDGATCCTIIYAGIDRTTKQSVVSPVIFSKEFDNLTSDEYLNSLVEFKNVAIVAGEDTGSDRVYLEVARVEGDDPLGAGNGTYYQNNRRELFVDARDIQSEKEGSEEKYTTEEYEQLLRQRGLEKLNEYNVIAALEASADTTTTQFIYNKDYFIGDIVTIITNFGVELSARITEVVRSLDNEGYSVNPTFELV